MSTGFLYKKIGKGAVCFLAFALILFSFGYAWYLSSAIVVNTSKSFYFLISSSTHIEVSTHEATQMGGAGYLFEVNGREVVALSAYIDETEAVTVNAGLKDGQMEVLLLESSNLYLKTRKQKQKESVYKNAFANLYSCIDSLNGEIARLEKGATQQSSKRILKALKERFVIMGKENEKQFPQFTKFCKNAEEQLTSSISGVVYLEDLRYLTCDLCLSYIRLSEEFCV